MTNIIKFPIGEGSSARLSAEPIAKTTPINKGRQNTIVSSLVKGVWVLTVLLWPLLKWIVSIEVFFQFVRMVYHWNTPNVYAGWTFMLHFSVLTALTYFVSLYKPKGL